MHALEQHQINIINNSNKNNNEKKIEGSKPVPQNEKEKQDQLIKQNTAICTSKPIIS